MEVISHVSLSSDATNIDFTSIPSTYTDLLLVMSLKHKDTGSGQREVAMQFNGDTGNNYQGFQSNSYEYGSWATGGRSGWGWSSDSEALVGTVPCSETTSVRNTDPNAFGPIRLWIPRYSDTTGYKTLMYQYGGAWIADTDAGFKTDWGRGQNMWKSTAAINRITVLTVDAVASANRGFKTYSMATLYGLTNTA